MNIATGTIHKFDQTTDEDGYGDRLQGFQGAFAEDSQGWLAKDADNYVSPDGNFKISRGALPKGAGVFYGPRKGEHAYFLTEGKQVTISMETLPGFMPVAQIDGWESLFVSNGSPFVSAPGFAAVFLRHHLAAPMANKFGD